MNGGRKKRKERKKERKKEKREKEEEKKSMIIVVPSCLKDADGARTRSDQITGLQLLFLHRW